MKFSIDAKTIAAAAGWVARAAGRDAATPILSGMKITAGEESVSLAACDYERSHRTSVGAAVFEPGQIVVPGTLFAAALSKLGDGQAEVAAEDTHAIITCGKTRFTIPLYPAGDYPALPSPGDVIGEVDAEHLRDAVKRTAYAAATGKAATATPILSGVLVTMEGDSCTLVASNRYRMPVTVIPWTSTQGGEEGLLVPPQALEEFINVAVGPVRVSMVLGGDGAPSTIGLSSGPYTATARLIAGQFPPAWRTLLAKADHPTSVTFEVGEMLAALERANLVRTKLQPVVVNIGDDGIIDVSVEGVTGTVSDTFEVVQLEGPGVRLKMNGEYTVAALKHIGAERAVLRASGPLRPVLMLPAVEDPTHRIMLMPLKESVPVA